MTYRLTIALLTLILPLQMMADEPTQDAAPQKEEVASPSKAAPKPTKQTAPSFAEPDTSMEDIRPQGDPPQFELGYQKQFFNTLIAIVIIILVALFVIWIIRKAAPARVYRTNKQKNIKVIERRAISAQTYLYHIQVGEKQFIVSESKMDVRHITTLDWPDSNC